MSALNASPDMASGSKRAWIYQNLNAHDANVNCVALGRKSGTVMVTGSEDKCVKLWAIGKTSCFMTLQGHTTPVDCVHFNNSEEFVLSGSRTGALKVWDLEAALLIRTLTGHRDAIHCMDFHPYGHYLASGSADCAIKVWDSRRKRGSVLNFSGHADTVNSVKFSPDGNWIVSGSDDHSVKLWDTRIGKMLVEFRQHTSAVTAVEFHPHEFLLASGGNDRVVNYYDVETFKLVSSETNLGLVRCMQFHRKGECLFVGLRDCFKVLGWEPNRVYDSVNMGWGRVWDIASAENQLIGASFHMTHVFVHIENLKSIKPFGGPAPETPSSFMPNTSLRKSFSRAERPLALKNHLDVKTIEESTSGTDPEEESSAAINNQTDYEEIFRPGRALNRTPPLVPSPETETPQAIDEPTMENHVQPHTDVRNIPQIIETCEDHSMDPINFHRGSTMKTSSYSRSKSNLDQVYSNRNSKQDNRENVANNLKSLQPLNRQRLPRQNSCKESAADVKKQNNIRQSVSEVNLNKNSNTLSTRNNLGKNSFSRTGTQTSNITANLTKIPMTSRHNANDKPMNIFNSHMFPSSEKIRSYDNDFIPVSIDKPVGLQLDDFLPKNHDAFGKYQLPSNMSDAEVLNVVMGGHQSMISVMQTRSRHLALFFKQFRERDVKTALEIAADFNNLAVMVDILDVVNSKPSAWSLDLCVLILPKIEELIGSKYESYITTACDSLRIILRNFGAVIKESAHCSVGSYGIDLSREERFKKATKCQQFLESIRLVIYKKQSYPDKVGLVFKEVHTLIQSTLD